MHHNGCGFDTSSTTSITIHFSLYRHLPHDVWAIIKTRTPKFHIFSQGFPLIHPSLELPLIIMMMPSIWAKRKWINYTNYGDTSFTLVLMHGCTCVRCMTLTLIITRKSGQGMPILAWHMVRDCRGFGTDFAERAKYNYYPSNSLARIPAAIIPCIHTLHHLWHISCKSPAVHLQLHLHL